MREISKLSKKKAIENIHKQLLKKYSGAIKVWIIQGGLVRSLYFIDFTEGGHDLVYPHFIPKNEVWLDDDLSPGERKPVSLDLHAFSLTGFPLTSLLSGTILMPIMDGIVEL